MRFCKYQSLGNDFVLTCFSDEVDYARLAPQICDRRTGVGADGLITVESPTSLAPKMRVFNADGSPAAMCGNGLRCAALFCLETQSNKKKLVLSTANGEKTAEIISEYPFLCRTNLGKPILFGKKAGLPSSGFWGKTIVANKKPTTLFCLSTGVPHAVVFEKSNTKIAKKVQNLSVFVDKCNVDFVSVTDKNKIICRTYERGVGWTEACGTGAAACAFVCFCLNKCNAEVSVEFFRGSLAVKIEKDGIFVTGGASKVFEGEFECFLPPKTAALILPKGVKDEKY